MIRKICKKCNKEFEAAAENIFEVPMEYCGQFCKAWEPNPLVYIFVCNKCLEINGRPFCLFHGMIEFDTAYARTQ